MRRWLGLAALIGVQIAYPLATGGPRTLVVVVTVLLGFALSVGHAGVTRGPRTGLALVAVMAGGGLAVEAVGVGTGFPFGPYAYTGTLGPQLLGVPLLIPLAWTWMAWPAWLAAGQLVARFRPSPVRATTPAARTTAVRVLVAAVALAGWDVFLDPQMVAQHYWVWSTPGGTVPVSNYVGWLGVALVLMAAFAAAAGRPVAEPVADARVDTPMLALYLWTYYSSVLAHAVFLGLPASARWGALGMGLVAVPLTLTLIAPLWKSPVPTVAARQ